MRKTLYTFAALALAATATGWFLSAPPRVPAATLAAIKSAPGDAQAGKLVFYAGGCESCHQSAGQDDPLKLGGGRELKTPFGSFYPPNISQDSKDGIGAWTLEDFAGALLAGRTPNGQPYYPAFPYTSYTHVAPKDVADLYAFLKTLPAAQGRAPPHGLGFPFNMRRGVGLWQRLFFAQGPLPEDPDKDEVWQRGRYLVEGPGHCSECHSPRNPIGGIKSGERYAGGMDPEGKGWVPNITSHADGIGAWKEAEIAEFLKSGLTPSFDAAGGSMAEVIENTGRLTDADRTAMATYIASLPPLPGKSPAKKP